MAFTTIISIINSILLFCNLLLPCDVDIHQFLLALIELFQEYFLEKFILIEAGVNLYHAKDNTLSYISIGITHKNRKYFG
jgi:hypothetical protein